jgi:hypothetical protein
LIFGLRIKQKIDIDLGDRIGIGMKGIREEEYFFVKMTRVENLDGFGY